MLKTTFCSVALSSAIACAQCTPHWEAVGFHADSVGEVKTQLWFDDGHGPALFVGGIFSRAANSTALNIARISAGIAAPLASGLDGSVAALVAYDAGSGPQLYAGGAFTAVDDPAIRNLARWDGAAWHPVSSGVDGPVTTLVAHNDGSGTQLYVGGLFTHAALLNTLGVARWNGSAWSTVGAPLGPHGSGDAEFVLTMLSRPDPVTPLLYLAGRIATVGGIPCSRVIAWNGSAWQNVGSDLGSASIATRSLALYDNGSGLHLYRACSDGLQYLDSTWVPVTSTAIAALQPLADGSSAGRLYFSAYHNNSFGYLAGTSLQTSAIDSSSSPAPDPIPFISSLLPLPSALGPTLSAGGSFLKAGSAVVSNLATYTVPVGWSSSESIGGAALVTDYLPAADQSAAYVGFATATPLNGAKGIVAKVSSNSASLLPAASGGMITRLAWLDTGSGPSLYATGYSLRTSSSVTWRTITAWHNDVELPLPPGLNASQSFSSGDILPAHRTAAAALYFAGRFSTSLRPTPVSLLELSASGFAPFTPPVTDAVWGARLASRATPAGEVIYMSDLGDVLNFPVNYRPLRILDPIAGWSYITAALTHRLAPAADYDFPVAWFDDGDGGHLYIAGHFDAVDVAPAQCIARLEGNHILPLASGVTGGDPLISDLTVFDDGTGPALYAVGRFTAAGGVPASNIARYRHGAWEAVGSGLQGANVDPYRGPVSRARVVSSQGSDWLYVAGTFSQAGGMVSPRVARYGNCTPCPADFNRDGSADLFDYLDFVDNFAAGRGNADFNRDGTIDLFDYLDFISAFAAGC